MALSLLSLPGAPTVAQEASTRYARLIVITDFDTTSIEINGVAYPWEWIYGGSEGVLLPAPRSYRIVVANSPERQRTYNLRLRADETRVLVVDVEHLGTRAAAPPPAAPLPIPADAPPTAEEENSGFLGVSSSPRGIVHVDGVSTGQRTPARRIPLEPGRHEVTVFYDEEGVMSEVKHVLIRSGVNTNVFFRLRRDAPTE
jgi:hypothetical protein